MIDAPYPPLRGSLAQVKWATQIRTNELNEPRSTPHAERLVRIVDATWWIANRDKETNDRLAVAYKAPHPYQLEGGPPGPGALNDGPDEPHEAELFAGSVCHHPALAEVAVLGLMAKQYMRSSQKDVGELLLYRARQKVDGLRERIIADVDRDIDGLMRILK